MKKVIVAGSRSFNDFALLYRTLESLFKEEIIIVSGCAEGADRLGEEYARCKNYFVEKHPANWSDLNAKPCRIKYGKYGPYNALAGHNRNKEMLNSVMKNEDGGCVVVFWDGKSTGTKNMIDISQKANIEVKIIKI